MKRNHYREETEKSYKVTVYNHSPSKLGRSEENGRKVTRGKRPKVRGQNPGTIEEKVCTLKKLVHSHVGKSPSTAEVDSLGEKDEQNMVADINTDVCRAEEAVASWGAGLEQEWDHSVFKPQKSHPETSKRRTLPSMPWACMS